MMATADEYAAWIVKNSDKRGTPEFDIVAKAYEAAKQDDGATQRPPARQSRAEMSARDWLRMATPDIGTVGDILGGGLSGAASIGASILAPKDAMERAAWRRAGVTPPTSDRRADIEEGLRQAGADTESGAYQIGRIGGQIAGTAGLGGGAAAAAKAAGISQSALASLLGRSVTGAADAGAMALVSNPEDAGLAAGIGAALPGLGQTSRYVFRKARNTSDLFMPGGAGRIFNRYVSRQVGDDLPNVTRALSSVDEILPGGRPTAAQATAGTRGGSVLSSLENTTAKTPGGISTKFEDRWLGQDMAEGAADIARRAATTPMREAALKAANQGGVVGRGVLSDIRAMKAQKGLPEITEKTLDDIYSRVRSKVSRATGNIDADDLYAIRKDIGITIDKFATDKQRFDKKFTAGVERQVQTLFDDAIERAGAGAQWRAYLDEYASRSRDIDAFRARRELARKPVQETDLRGGVNIGEETRPKLPNMLSRPMMATNAVLRMLGGGVEPKIDKYAAMMLLDPKTFSEALKRVPFSERKAVIDAWNMVRGPLAAQGAGLLSTQE